MESYNGWKNYPTWCLALWLDNDYNTYHYWQERSMEFLEDSDGDLEKAEIALSYELESCIESEVQDSIETSGYISDILTWALGKIDWLEIAEHISES